MFKSNQNHKIRENYSCYLVVRCRTIGNNYKNLRNYRIIILLIVLTCITCYSIIPGKPLHLGAYQPSPPSLASGLAPLLSPEQSLTCFYTAISNSHRQKMAYLFIVTMMNSFYVNRIWLISRKYIHTVDSFKSFPSRQSTHLIHQRILI